MRQIRGQEKGPQGPPAPPPAPPPPAPRAHTPQSPVGHARVTRMFLFTATLAPCPHCLRVPRAEWASRTTSGLTGPHLCHTVSRSPETGPFFSL